MGTCIINTCAMTPATDFYSVKINYTDDKEIA